MTEADDYKTHVGVRLLYIPIALLTLATLISATVVGVFITGILVVVTLVLLLIGLYIDKYEPEPPAILLSLFLWGGFIATLGSIIINSGMGVVFGAGIGASFSAPVFEEFFKALGIVLVYRRYHHHAHSLTDGIVYAFFVGSGFAIVEDGQYLVEGYQTGGAFSMVFTAILRCLATPFLHQMFTACTAIALVLAFRNGRKASSGLIVIAGYTLAVVLHALWNSFGIIMYLPMMAWLIILVVIISREHRRRRRDYHMYILPLVTMGHFHQYHYIYLTRGTKVRDFLTSGWANMRGQVGSLDYLRQMQTQALEIIASAKGFQKGEVSSYEYWDEVETLKRMFYAAAAAASSASSSAPTSTSG